MNRKPSLDLALKSFDLIDHGGEVLRELAPIVSNRHDDRHVLVFLDTEFTDFIDCELISIGMVTEGGDVQFYAERNDFRRDWCKSAVTFNILPLLGGVQAMNREQLRGAVDLWLRSFGYPIQLLCDSSTDWELLVDLFDGALPSTVQGCSVMTEAASSPEYVKAVYTYHSAPGRPWHHALHDACAMQAGWAAIPPSVAK